MYPGLVEQDLVGYLTDFRILFSALFFVTRVAGSAADFVAAGFAGFFGVIFFSATWFTSPSRSRPRRAHEHTPASSAPDRRSGVSLVTRLRVTSVTGSM